jgi:GlpG protein
MAEPLAPPIVNSENEWHAFVTIKQHNVALLFSHYLSTLAITTQLKHVDEGYTLYCSAEQLAIVKQEFDTFIKQPDAAKYQQAAWQSAQPKAVNSDRPPLLDSFKKQFLAHAGVFTLVIFIACWVVFTLKLLGFGEVTFSYLHFFTHLSIDQLIHQPYRLLGPAFFHFSWMHIVFNTLWWWQLGGDIEKKLGKVTLINVFLVSAIISNLGQFFVSGPSFGGLSGVVYGVMGFVWWSGWLMPKQGLSLPKPLVGFLLFWIMLGYADMLPVNMANTAHLLGLVSGCLMAIIWAKCFQVTAKE